MRLLSGEAGAPPNDVDVAVVSDSLTRFDLAEVRRDRMHQVSGSATDRANAARATFGQARDLRRAAVGNLVDTILALAEKKLPTRRISPPPR
jgi:hypothetical protein